MKTAPLCRVLMGVTFALAAASALPAHAAWEPTKPVELVVPAGTGGGADQMARFLQGVVAKHNLMKQPIVVVNKSGGAGAEGFLDVKGAKGEPHKLVITLSNLFTTPLATGVPFNWSDLTPVAMLALDEFVLWVNAEAPYKTVNDYVKAIKAGDNGRFKMAGTGSKQEDQIITVALERSTGAKFTYVPFKGGGDVATQLVGKHVDSTVNNPIECVSHWKANRVRPLAVFDTERISVGEWKSIPTVKEALGADLNYLMLRGIFGAPDMPKEAEDCYVDFLRKVTETPEWKKYMEDGALKSAFLTGPEYVKWVEQNEALHKELMTKGGLLKK